MHTISCIREHIHFWLYLHCNFSSKLPFDVTDRARINSSNSIEPSCDSESQNSKEILWNTTAFFQEMRNERERERGRVFIIKDFLLNLFKCQGMSNFK